MKKLALVLVLIMVVPAIAHAFSHASGDDPEFKVEETGKAGFTVTYSWPGEGKGPINCTVTVRVKYSGWGDKDKKDKSEEFSLSREVHNTGSGWAEFDGKSDLDTHSLDKVSIVDHRCR